MIDVLNILVQNRTKSPLAIVLSGVGKTVFIKTSNKKLQITS
jgi:hypothetical protein